jgi:tetratricopeptide (TPR) repeat protein
MELLEEAQAIFRAQGHWMGVSSTLNQLANEATYRGDYALARRRLNESLSLTQRSTALAGISAYEMLLSGRLALREGDYARAWAELEESAQRMRDAGQNRHSTWSLVSLGYTALRQGDLQRAQYVWEQSLPLFHKANSLDGVVFTEEGFASLAVQQQRPARAARLFAWADAMREAIDDDRPPVEQDDVDRDLAVIHTQLDDAAFQAEQAIGRRMTLDEAIAYALTEV